MIKACFVYIYINLEMSEAVEQTDGYPDHGFSACCSSERSSNTSCLETGLLVIEQSGMSLSPSVWRLYLLTLHNFSIITQSLVKQDPMDHLVSSPPQTPASSSSRCLACGMWMWKLIIPFQYWQCKYENNLNIELHWGVQSFSLVQMKVNLWKECKDGKGLVTEIYYGWTGGYPYMKVRQASSFYQTNIFLWSQWLFSTNAFQMLQSPLYGVASKLPAASTMVPVIVDHHDPACVHY